MDATETEVVWTEAFRRANEQGSSFIGLNGLDAKFFYEACLYMGKDNLGAAQIATAVQAGFNLSIVLAEREAKE